MDWEKSREIRQRMDSTSLTCCRCCYIEKKHEKESRLKNKSKSIVRKRGAELLGRPQHGVSKTWFSISREQHKDLVTQVRMQNSKIMELS